MNKKKEKIVVVGAGVIGLSTAVCIQENISDADVTLVADKFNEETLSYGAGGLFRPEVNIGISPDIIKRWSENSYKHFIQIAMSNEAENAGVQIVSGYQMNSYDKERLKNEIVSQIVPEVREMTQREHEMFPNRFKYGIFWTTFIADPRYYLSWLTKKFTSKGGKKLFKHVNHLKELADYDIIVNCTGLNAKYLVDDWKMTPVRGQAIKVKAPWIKHFYYGDGAYIIPGRDYVTLGGVKEYGDWNTNLDQFDRKSIWQRCIELVPSLETAQIAFEWVGLRPQRQPVRVEKEIVKLDNHDKSRLKVVHNYGHGAHGISLSWGTALHATQLVQEFLNENFISKL